MHFLGLQINRSILVAHIVAVLVCVLSFNVMVAFASQVIVIIEGSRDAKIGTDFIDFGNISLGPDEQIVSGIDLGADGVTVNDLDPSSASWSVSVAASHMNYGSGGEVVDQITYDKLAVKGDSDGAVEKLQGITNTDGISTFTNYTAFSGSGAQSNDITLVSADNRVRESVYKVTPEFQLTVPNDIIPGTYENEFTFTFVVN